MSIDAPPATLPATLEGLDPADHAQAETALYQCGTIAPGNVHDPCQHSLVRVLCCTCAGCVMDVWFCGFEISDPWGTFSAQQIAARADPWMRSEYALLVYAFVAIAMLTSHVIQMVCWVVFFALALALTAGGYLLAGSVS
jgi:hypothetical protein